MKKFLGILAFWGIAFLGPGLVVLFAQFSYSVVGAGESFPSEIVYLISQGLACYLAYLAVVKITKEPGGYCARYNCMICTLVMGCMALTDFVNGTNLRAVALAIAAVISGACVYEVIKAYGDKAKDETVQVKPESGKAEVPSAEVVTVEPKAQKMVEPAEVKSVKTTEPGAKKPKGTVPAWLLVAVCCVAVAAVGYLLVVYVPGIQGESQGSYDSGYQAGYAAGKEFQREKDVEGLTVGNKNLKTLVTLVESQYGVGPREAYDLVMDYADQGANSGYSYDEYENALEAILYFAELVPDGY